MSFIKKLFSRIESVDKSKNRVLKFDKSDYEASYDIALARFKMIGIRLMTDDLPLAKLLWNSLYVFEFASLILTMILELTNMVLQAADGIYTDVFKMTPCVGFIIIEKSVVGHFANQLFDHHSVFMESNIFKFLATVKTYKIFLYRPVYKNLMSELRDMWPQDAVTEEEYNIIRPKLMSLHRFAKGYWYCNAALLAIFGSVPFIISVQNLLGYDAPLTFILSYWFPFDPFKHGRFEVLAALQTWLCFLAVSFISGADILYCVYLSHITTQFDLLAIRIKKMFYVPTDKQLIEAYPLTEHSKKYINGDSLSNSTNNYEKMYRNNIVEVVLRHRALIRLSGVMEKQFSFPLLINFLNSSILICFCGFCCMFIEKWNEINYKLFLLSANVQIWLLCWYGQNLIDSSKRVSDAIYCCGWYNVSENLKSFLIIMFYRTQKAVYLTTYGFSIVSIESYSAILKTSWSYLMLLKNIFDK